MTSNLKLVLDFYIFFSIVTLIISVVLFLMTKNFNQRKIKVLGLFLDLSRNDCIILATNLYQLILTIYCVININKFCLLFMAMFIINALVTIILSLKIHIIVAEIIYTSVTVGLITLLNLINTFLTTVNYDKMTHILSIVFLCTIIVYAFFITVRKLELVLKKNRFVRRNV